VTRGFGKEANQTQLLPCMLPAGEEVDWNHRFLNNQGMIHAQLQFKIS